MGRAGIEPATHGFSVQAKERENEPIPHDSSAGAAPALQMGRISAVSDPDLRLLTEAWPTLPDPLKAGILAMVKAAVGG